MNCNPASMCDFSMIGVSNDLTVDTIHKEQRQDIIVVE